MRRTLLLLPLALATLSACRRDGGGADPETGVFGLSKSQPSAKVGAGLEPAMLPREGGPRIGAVRMMAAVHDKPDRRSTKIGYLRAGAATLRGEKPVKIDDCPNGWFRVAPAGYVCASEDATIDPNHPILKALTRRPDLSKPMPYPYAFVRAIAPNYYRVPTKAEQYQYEMALEKHLRSYKKLKDKWDEVKVGANDVPLDAVGNATGEPPAEPPPLDDEALWGGDGDSAIPWFFKGGRKIPNISSFRAPDYAVITNRIARKAGLALVDTFVGDDGRRFAMTTDARLIPTSKLKPARGSTFHGLDLSKGWELPVAFVSREEAHRYDLSRLSLDKKGALDFHAPLQLTGRSKRIGDTRFVEIKDGTWAKETDLAIAAKPSSLPSFARGKTKWIDVSIQTQTLVMYEGSKAVYATAVATGKDGLGDPKKTFSTVRGTFRIREKHVTTTMDSHESGNQFELRDVPWVQYFEAGYALHAAPWHDDYGRPRSHGCINLSPIDARRLFLWSDPQLPKDWHGVNAHTSISDGTLVHVHP